MTITRLELIIIAVVLVLLLMSGCAAFDAVYWCLQSPPGKGGPFCP